MFGLTLSQVNHPDIISTVLQQTNPFFAKAHERARSHTPTRCPPSFEADATSCPALPGGLVFRPAILNVDWVIQGDPKFGSRRRNGDRTRRDKIFFQLDEGSEGVQ